LGKLKSKIAGPVNDIPTHFNPLGMSDFEGLSK